MTVSQNARSIIGPAFFFAPSRRPPSTCARAGSVHNNRTDVPPVGRSVKGTAAPQSKATRGACLRRDQAGRPVCDTVVGRSRPGTARVSTPVHAPDRSSATAVPLGRHRPQWSVGHSCPSTCHPCIRAPSTSPGRRRREPGSGTETDGRPRAPRSARVMVPKERCRPPTVPLRSQCGAWAAPAGRTPRTVGPR